MHAFLSESWLKIHKKNPWNSLLVSIGSSFGLLELLSTTFLAVQGLVGLITQETCANLCLGLLGHPWHSWYGNQGHYTCTP